MDFTPRFTEIHRPSSTLSVIEQKHPDYAFDDHDPLEPSFLDGAIMSPTNSAVGLFSPDSTLWEDFPSTATTTTFPDRPFSSALPHVPTNPFVDHSSAATSNNPFTRLGASQVASYGQQAAHPWPPSDSTSGSRTPTGARPYDGFAQEFDAAPPASFVPAPAPSFSGLPMPANVRPSSVFPPAQVDNPSRPLSPHNHKEWMEMAAQETQPRPGPHRMRASSPPRSSPFPRRDGIRKKNARFEIPAERSLLNIDQLIQNATNDEEIKELKQQKRLLRNRQAALDSRQRKKRHTEELEEEKKHFTERIGMLEEELANMRLHIDALRQEKEQMHQQHMEHQQIIQQLTWDKEELVCAHTQETGELRKKISVLTEKLDANAAAMSIAPSSASFADFASEMDNLHMGAGDWDNYIFVDNFGLEPESTHQRQQSQETAIVVPHRKKESLISDDKPVASGFLFMLLLCGAFVASKSSGTSAPPIPRMPDEVRVASATVLDNILKDAGVPSVPDQALETSRMEALEPRPSGVAWQKHNVAGAEFPGLTHSRSSGLDQLHAHLAGPTKDQEAEQIFSITPSQYNSLTSSDFGRRMYSIGSEDDALSPNSQSSHHRRNLAETLAAMREESKGDTAAEVYTRSLLWDRIPSEVVREFKRMVEESDRLAAASSGNAAAEDCKGMKFEAVS